MDVASPSRLPTSEDVPEAMDVEMQLKAPRPGKRRKRGTVPRASNRKGALKKQGPNVRLLLLGAFIVVLTLWSGEGKSQMTRESAVQVQHDVDDDCELLPGGCRHLTASSTPTEYEELKQLLQEQHDADNDRGYTIYKLEGAWKVLLMQLGFACLEAGAVPGKHVGLMLVKNVVDMCITGVVWQGGYLLTGFEDISAEEWLFHYTFAATCGTVVSGAIAGRMKVAPYFVYIAINTGVIYPLVVRIFWAHTYTIGDIAFHDFAGAGVVHLLAGSCAFVAVTLVGPRQKVQPTHSFLFVFLGDMLLFYGWLGFNGGSLLREQYNALDEKPLLGDIWRNTVLGGCSGLVTAFFWRSFLPQFLWRFPILCCDPNRDGVTSWLRWWRTNCQPDWGIRPKSFKKSSPPKLDFFSIGNGLIAGLVAVTAWCDEATHVEAIALGACGATAYCMCSCGFLISHRYRKDLGHGSWWPWNWGCCSCCSCCRITLRHRMADPQDIWFWFDDIVDAVSVHGAAGFAGVCVFPLLRWDLDQLLVQFVGCLYIMGIGLSGTFVVLFSMRIAQDADVWRRLRARGAELPLPLPEKTAPRKKAEMDAWKASWKGYEQVWDHVMHEVQVRFELSMSATEERGGIDVSEFGTTAVDTVEYQEYLQRYFSIIPDADKDVQDSDDSEGDVDEQAPDGGAVASGGPAAGVPGPAIVGARADQGLGSGQGPSANGQALAVGVGQTHVLVGDGGDGSGQDPSLNSPVPTQRRDVWET